MVSRFVSTACAIAALFCLPSSPAGAAPAAVDREETHRLLGLERKGGRLVNECGEPAKPKIDIVDLNGDGQPEVVALLTGSICYGGAGGRLSLFIRTAGGWKDQFGFPAGDYRILARRRSGYPDIEIGGPGMCQPVWGWTGRAYGLVKRCER
jgi:hypothetical protein